MYKPVFLYLVIWLLSLLSPGSYSLSEANLDVHHYKVLARQTLEIPALIEVNGEAFVFPVAIYGNPYHRFKLVSLPDALSGELSLLFSGPVDVLKTDNGIRAEIFSLDNGEYRLDLYIKGGAWRIEREVVVQGEGSLLPLKSRFEFYPDSRNTKIVGDELPDHWLSYIAPDTSSRIPVVANDVVVFMMRSYGRGSDKGGGKGYCTCPACENERRKAGRDYRDFTVEREREMSVSPRQGGDRGFRQQFSAGGARVSISISGGSSFSVGVTHSSTRVTGNQLTRQRHGFLLTPQVEMCYQDKVTIRKVEEADKGRVDNTGSRNVQALEGQEDEDESSKPPERCNCAACQGKYFNPPPPPPSSGASSAAGY